MQLMFVQSLSQFRVPIISVSECPAEDICQHLFGNSRVMNVGWGNAQTNNYTRPANTQMSSYAKEGLPGYLIMAISGDFSQASTAISPCKAANRKWEAIDDRESRVHDNVAQQVLPEQRFHLPQVGRLSNISCAMDVPQTRKPVTPVPPEMVEDRFISTHTQESTDHFDSQHLAVMQGWLWATLVFDTLKERQWEKK